MGVKSRVGSTPTFGTTAGRSGPPTPAPRQWKDDMTGTRDECQFWNCSETVRRAKHFLCYDHYDAYQERLVVECPGCGLYTDADLCLDCKSARLAPSTSSPKRYRREQSKAWEAGDAEAKVFYVYVLKLDDGSFYAGQTRELQERLMEHRDGRTKSTRDRDPKLVWFTIVESRDEATKLEPFVKELCARDPREIRRWIVEFQSLVSLLDFT